MVSWNVKGLNKDRKRGLVRNLINQWVADVYILVETKLVGSVNNIIQSIWDNRWVGEVHLEVVGTSGGILILWDRRVWEGQMAECGNQCITCKMTGQNSDFTWFLTAVYADCKKIERRELWGELYSMKERCAGPWVVGGDFNVIRYPIERTNCLRINGAMAEFSECIEELELVDPPLFGGSFTWRRGENHRSASRIDRFLYSSTWEEQFTLIKQSVLAKIGSDHNPILLSCGELKFKKSYFRFENWWIGVEGFKENVKLWWGSFVVDGRPCFVLAEKPKMGNWKQRKEDILNQLANWEAVQEQRILTDDEAVQKSNLAMEYEEVARNEEIAWKQRSRIQWLKQGDKNTKYFHRIATAHKRVNSIDNLTVGEMR
ncbi:uncharacterized protein LOC132045677 [Lycium ferocissimum]|uniref:uncharacterized protein LOC132045677 n=1 Tax=Lycium ferocissimum TaxID=112874 RepID=UPI002814FB8B|nr:uncharacterized protein LOC132045677 [Lycium ferocissimum]